MKAFGSSYIACGLFAGRWWHLLRVPWPRHPRVQRCGVLLLAALALLLGGCATQPGENSTSSGGIGVALAGPVVGAEGLVRSLKKVSPQELAEREGALTNALGEMASEE